MTQKNKQELDRQRRGEPVAHPMGEVMGYRLEFKPGEYCYYTPEGYALEAYKGDAPAHALYANPQPGCPSEVEVYKGWCWVRPKYNFGKIVDETFRPLFLGPQLGAPVSAQAQPENFDNDTKMVAGCCGRSECGGECGNDWVGMVQAQQDADIDAARKGQP